MKTNSLKHQIVKVYTENGTTYRAKINIRLNDECKNGHQDFAVTVDQYRKGKNGSWYEDSFGCQHDLVLKLAPQLKPFVDLHLCDYAGAPMYPEANGFYWLEESRKDSSKLITAQEYVRATDQEFEVLKTAEDQQVYKYHLEQLGIVARWKTEADQAIKLLESMTGNEFENDSRRGQYTPLTDQEKKEIEGKITSGYYTPAKIEERAQTKLANAREKITQDLIAEKNAKIWKIECEYQVDMAAHNAGLPIDNLIFYNHTSEAVFNWQDSAYHSKITKQQFDDFVNSGASSLPFGVTWKLGK